jgi:hypothetical protein
MNDPAVALRRTAPDYQAALEKMAQIQEGLASELARAMVVLTEPMHRRYLFVPKALPGTNHYPMPGALL